MTVLRILHLYPAELGINGDAGNVLAIAERARWRGIDVETVAHAPGAELPPSADMCEAPWLPFMPSSCRSVSG